MRMHCLTDAEQTKSKVAWTSLRLDLIFSVMLFTDEFHRHCLH